PWRSSGGFAARPARPWKPPEPAQTMTKIENPGSAPHHPAHHRWHPVAHEATHFLRMPADGGGQGWIGRCLGHSHTLRRQREQSFIAARVTEQSRQPTPSETPWPPSKGFVIGLGISIAASAVIGLLVVLLPL